MRALAVQPDGSRAARTLRPVWRDGDLSCCTGAPLLRRVALLARTPWTGSPFGSAVAVRPQVAAMLRPSPRHLLPTVRVPGFGQCIGSADWPQPAYRWALSVLRRAA